MSFQITKPGFYRQRNGGKAEVFAERGGRWYGLTATGLMEWWEQNGIQRASAGDFCGDIVSEYHEPKFKVGDLVLVNAPQFTAHHNCYGTVALIEAGTPFVHVNTGKDFETEAGCPFKEHELTPITLPAPLPAGFRLKPRNVRPVRGVDVGMTSSMPWEIVREWSRATAGELDTAIPGESPHFFAEPIPKPEPPFRISDHGCGVYETAGGDRAFITSRGSLEGFPWEGYIDNENKFNKSWSDDGVWQIGTSQHRLVRYIGPLPEPQPEWVATNRWRNRVLNRDAGGTLPDSTISCVVDGAWKFVVPEQLWTCGDREDWRTAEVQR